MQRSHSCELRHHCEALQTLVCFAVTHNVAMPGACLAAAPVTSGYSGINPLKEPYAMLHVSYNVG